MGDKNTAMNQANEAKASSIKEAEGKRNEKLDEVTQGQKLCDSEKQSRISGVKKMKGPEKKTAMDEAHTIFQECMVATKKNEATIVENHDKTLKRIGKRRDKALKRIQIAHNQRKEVIAEEYEDRKKDIAEDYDDRKKDIADEYEAEKDDILRKYIESQKANEKNF